jgi:spore germination cell wall hydrolase CwlJ-like protein
MIFRRARNPIPDRRAGGVSGARLPTNPLRGLFSWPVAGWGVVVVLVGAHQAMEIPPSLPAHIFGTQVSGFPRGDLDCLALNIYFEARGEPEVGKLAVGHVVMNRVADPRFPDTACAVIREGGEARRDRCQFSWWCDGRSDWPEDVLAWKTSLRVAEKIVRDPETDPTQGALWYHADYVAPDWRLSLDEGPKIGRHIFYHLRTDR